MHASRFRPFARVVVRIIAAIVIFAIVFPIAYALTFPERRGKVKPLLVPAAGMYSVYCTHSSRPSNGQYCEPMLEIARNHFRGFAGSAEYSFLRMEDISGPATATGGQ